METVTREPAYTISVAADDTTASADGAVPSLDHRNCSHEYHAESETHRVSYDTEDDTVRPSTAVVEVVAAITGTKPTELPPLYAVVDPDALDAVLEPSAQASEHSEKRLSFSYEGYTVSIRGD